MTLQAAERSRMTFHPLTVAAVERLCDDAAAVTFDVPPEVADRYAFRAGQSLTLRRPGDGPDERRSYSICAPEGGALRIGVREIPDGLVSRWLVHDLRPGDLVEVAPPTGRFTPAPGTAGHHVLVAAGSGITPVLSIVTTVLADPRASATLVYGNRRTSTVMFADELADLKDRHPDRLELIHVLSREPRDAELFTGRLDPARLTALLEQVIAAERVDQWWLCGPLDLVAGAQGVLASAGVDPRRVHRELFYAGDSPPPPVRHPEAVIGGATAEVTVVLDGRSTTTTLARDDRVLDGAQRRRPDLPFACKGGVCGTCRALVVEGEVAMGRNFALEEAEVAAGYVLTCQSVPRSERVTVDYDR